MGEEANPPPAKRRKRSTVTNEKEDFQGPDIIVRLLNEDATNLGLSYPTVMEFDRLDYLTFNSPKVAYLYVICAAIFDINNEKLTLTHIPTVKSLDEDDDTMMAWPLSEDDDQISKGTYCIIFDTDAGKLKVILGLIVLEPNLDLFKTEKKAKSATEEPSTAVKSSSIPRTPVNPTTSPAIPPSPGQWSESIKEHVIDRDRGCIVTDTRPSLCILSPIIPEALLQVWSTLS